MNTLSDSMNSSALKASVSLHPDSVAPSLRALRPVLGIAGTVFEARASLAALRTAAQITCRYDLAGTPVPYLLPAKLRTSR